MSKNTDNLYFFGQSEAGIIARSLAEQRSSLGSPESWPLELKTILTSLFLSRYPTCLFWGPRLNSFYNDACFPIVGEKHPEALGRPGDEVWPEGSRLFSPAVERVLRSGEPAWYEDWPLPITGAQGERREAYFTCSFTPVYLASGKINGVLVTCVETTEKVLCLQLQEQLSKELLLKTSAIENSLNGFDIVDEEGKFVYVNPAYARMWRYGSTEEVLKTSPADHCADPDIPLRIIAELRERGECDIEFLAKRKDGSVFDVRMLAYRAQDVSGKEIYPTTSIDISESKRAFEIFSTVANNISQFAWMTDSAGYITWYNQRWYDYTGTTLEEMRAKGWTLVHHPDHAIRVMKKWTEHLRSGEFWEDTFPLKGKNGGYRWFLSRAQPIRDEEGRILNWFGTNTDVTEKLKVEDVLKASEERFRNLAESMPHLVWTADAEGGADYYNSRMSEYAGASQSEDKKWNWSPLLHPDDLPQTEEKWRKAIESKSIYSCEHRLRMKDGSYRWHLSRAIPTFDPTGRIEKWYGTATDIHQHKLREEELANALSIRDEFLSVASHELKTPLTSLKLQAQLQARKQKRGESDTARDTVRTEELINRLDRLVNDMLDISRIRTGKLSISKEHADLVAVAREVVERLQPHFIEGTGEELGFLSPDEAWSTFDIQRIEQVLQNLLQNSIKYGLGGKVDLLIEALPNTLRVSVKDRGLGIDQKMQEKIFDRFERGVSATEISGIGLGLFICREIIYAHGGAIWVVSSLGAGSTFHFEIPRTY